MIAQCFSMVRICALSMAGMVLIAATVVADEIAPVMTKIGETEYIITIETIAGVEQLVYTDPSGQRFSRQEVQTLHAWPGKISRELAELQRSTPADKPLAIIVTLTQQPFGDIAAAARQRYGPTLDALEKALRRLNTLAQEPNRPLTAEEEQSWVDSHTAGIDPEVQRVRVRLIDRIDRVRTRMLHEIGSQVAQAVAPQQTAVVRLIETLGGKVANRITSMNALSADLSAGKLDLLAASDDVATLSINGQSSTHLNDSTCAVGANTLWSQGMTGSGFQAAVLDTGVKKDHPFLAPAQLQTHVALTYASTQPGFADVLTDIDILDHGTHVTGIVLSNLPGYLGVAYGATGSLHVKTHANFFPPPSGGTGNSWDSDVLEGADWALFQAANTPEVINGSFGAKAGGANDTEILKWLDYWIDTLGVSAVFSAGNDGQAPRSVASPCVAFNALCVANFDDGGTCSSGNDFIASSSSAGPAKDYRRKPEISAPGTNITSTSNNNFLATYSGTSMAAPHVAGASLLLSGLGILDPREQRALLVNSSRPVPNPLGGGSEWNGYGAMDLSNAWFHRNDVRKAAIWDVDAPFGSRRLYKGPMHHGERATLAINRHISRIALGTGGYQLTPFDLNTLKLMLYRESDNQQLAESTTAFDPLAVVEMSEPGLVDTIVKVASVGQFQHSEQTEIYALATQELFEEASVQPGVRFLGDIIAGPFPGSAQDFAVQVVMSNGGNARAHDVDLHLDWDVPAGWMVVPLGRTSRDYTDGMLRVGTLAPRESRSYRFVVRAPRNNARARATDAVTISVRGDVTSRSYGEVYTATGELRQRLATD